MAFIVEDGTGVKSANSYATVQEFKDYFADRPEDVSAILDATIQTLLVAATDYIDRRWGLRFLGRREFKTLAARSVLTLSGLPLADETVTVGTVVYTWKATPDPDTATEVEIGSSAVVSLDNLIAALGASGNTDFLDARFADPDVAALTIMTTDDGVATTETMTNGAFGAATTSGRSQKQQPLEFPRLFLKDRAGFDVTRVPDRLKAAVSEYAFRQNTADLDKDPITDDTGLRRTEDFTKVDVIEIKTEFAEETTATITRPYPAADRLLREYIRTGGPIR